MFTVVIAEKEHMDNLQEYQLFFKPFLKKNQFAFCQWNINDTDSLQESVPALAETVRTHEKWRLIVLCPDEQLHERNPFDVCHYTEPERNEGENRLEYYNRCQNLQYELYEKASGRPLVKLLTRLSSDPSVTRGTYAAEIREKIQEIYGPSALTPEAGEKAPEEENVTHADEEDVFLEEYDVLESEWRFLSYFDSQQKKDEIRRQIRGSEKFAFTLPSEILCVAKRTVSGLGEVLKTSWSEHDELLYSKFGDTNLYSDMIRYLIIDMESKEKTRYTYDYIRYMYAVLVLAGNEVPLGTLSPDRVYNLTCETDEEELRSFLSIYEGKLDITESNIKEMIREIERTPEAHLTNEESRNIFCGSVHVEVKNPEPVDRNAFFFRETIGLAEDCPSSEEARWMTKFHIYTKNMLRQLKMPRRAVKMAAEDVHALSVLDEERAAELNEFQLDDVKEHIEQEELSMIQTIQTSLYEEDDYLKRMQDRDQSVTQVMRQRMTKKKIFIFGGILLFVSLLALGFFFGENSSLPAYVIYSGAALLALVIIGIIAVALVLRHKVIKVIRDFNTCMLNILNEIDDTMRRYGVYLSHVTNVMRGHSVLDYRRKHGSIRARKIIILKKHAGDIEERKALLHQAFGVFMDDSAVKFTDEPEGFDYDFLRPVDYDYPLPQNKSMSRMIQFMEPDHLVEIPLGFVKRISIRREEFYD